MQITDIKIRKIFNEGPMKAVVSVAFDDALVVHDIKIINPADSERFFCVMPSKKLADEPSAISRIPSTAFSAVSLRRRSLKHTT